MPDDRSYGGASEDNSLFTRINASAARMDMPELEADRKSFNPSDALTVNEPNFRSIVLIHALRLAAARAAANAGGMGGAAEDDPNDVSRPHPPTDAMTGLVLDVTE